MDRIKEVYARVTADEKTVDEAIQKAKEQKVSRFPSGRVAAIAAGFVVIVAVGLAVFALRSGMMPDNSVAYKDAGAAEAIENENAYIGELAVNGIEVAAATLSSEELKVEYVILKESGYTPDSVTLSLEGEDGGIIVPLGAGDAVSEGDGWRVSARFRPVVPQQIKCRFYSGDTLLKEETVTVSEQ